MQHRLFVLSRRELKAIADIFGIKYHWYTRTKKIRNMIVGAID
jgi:hypothetical protein